MANRRHCNGGRVLRHRRNPRHSLAMKFAGPFIIAANLIGGAFWVANGVESRVSLWIAVPLAFVQFAYASCEFLKLK
jgi:heme/copper-type cytochrome/quinol oxidase subunit 4